MKKNGFVIANQAEEFLASYSVTDGVISRSWAIVPDLAFVFKTIQQADKVVQELESNYPLYVLGIKETDSKYEVFPPRKGTYPKWLFE